MMDPLLLKRWHRFRSHKRAFYSLGLLVTFFLFSLLAESAFNNQPYLVYYKSQFYFPILRFYPASTFGGSESLPTAYKELELTPSFAKEKHWMIFPPIRFSPDESDNALPSPPPSRPSRLHWLGTDDRGRDLLTRLVYGFRNSMTFALISCLFTVVVAYLIGGVQGFLGGYADLLGQRFVEMWSALPVLYVILFLLSLFPSSLILLTLVWVAFSWLGLSGYLRAEVLRLRQMDFVVAARALGAGTGRILFRHILPNALTPILTFFPFLIASSIGALAALDYLGLGLPPPTASWGELLRQGKENLSSWWLSLFPFLALFATLLLLTFVGEGVRSAFDSRD